MIKEAQVEAYIEVSEELMMRENKYLFGPLQDVSGLVGQ